jgi:Tripartite tricarboxylate transporter TctB family
MTVDAKQITRRLAPCLVVALIAFAYVLETRKFADPASKEAPILYSAAALCLCAVIGVRILARWRNRRDLADAGPMQLEKESILGQEPAKASLPRALAMIAIVAACAATIYIAGFYVATAVFLLLFMKFVSKLRLSTSLIFAVLAPLIIWICLGKLLNMDVYSGHLGSLLASK